MMPLKYNLIAVIGPTASGKTAFAAHLASRINGEIISADSRQIYRKMDLGTGKDYNDYRVGDSMIPAHLIDITDPGYKYSVFEYQRDFIRVFQEITGCGKLPVLCGGSGMYIDAATRRYRLLEVPKNEHLRKALEHKSTGELGSILAKMKTLHNTTDVDTVEHALRAIEIEQYYMDHPEANDSLPSINTLYLGVIYARETERKRITERLELRLKQGMVEEVKHLLDSGISAESLSYYGLEYRYITLYLTGRLEYSAMTGLLNTAIHQFAKRQRTWFRKMEREGCLIHWLDGELPMNEKLIRALELMNS